MARARYYGIAAAFGVVAGGAAYRFGMLAGVHDTVTSALQAIPLVAGLAAFFLIRGIDDSSNRRPSWLALIVAGVIAAAAVFGIAYVIAPPLPPLVEQKVTTRELPGFSIELPKHEEVRSSIEYTAGKIDLKDLGGRAGTLHLSWQFGEKPTDAAVLELGRAAARSVINDSTHVSLAPPIAGNQTLVLDGDKEIWMSFVTCGARMIVAVTVKVGDAGHRKLIGSIACHPIAEQENGKLDIPLMIDLPGFASTDETPGTVALVSDRATVMMRRQSTTAITPETYEKLVPQLLQSLALNAVVKTRKGDLVTFTATDENQVPEVGVVRFVKCPTATVLVLAIGDDQAAADDLEQRVVAARCREPGEAAQSWPAAAKPATP